MLVNYCLGVYCVQAPCEVLKDLAINHTKQLLPQYNLIPVGNKYTQYEGWGNNCMSDRRLIYNVTSMQLDTAKTSTEIIWVEK